MNVKYGETTLTKNYFHGIFNENEQKRFFIVCNAT